jgi:outer membrane lipoprotein-sorting protein
MLLWPAHAEADAALERLQKARRSLKTLRAKFTQERHIGLLATAVKSTGELTLVRPDRLRWELAAPDEVIYWIGPEGIAIGTKEGVSRIGKRAAGRFGAVLGDLMRLLAGDLGKLRKRYTLTLQSDARYTTLTAIPHDAKVKKQLAKLVLRMKTKQLWAMDRIVINEAGGDRSIIDFHSTVRDVPIDPKTMRPPPS